MATNTYTYGALGQRWTVGDPTSKANLDISRVKNDSLRWTVTQLLGDPDDDSGWNLDSFITPPPNVGGADTQIQFNNGGVFGGSSNLVWTGTNLEVTGVADITAPASSVGLSVDSTSGNVELQTDGQVYGYQKLDVATAGLQIKSYSDGGAAKTEQARLYMGQSTTSAAGGYFSFYTNDGTTIAERVLFDKDGNVTIASGNLSAASGTVTAEGVITDAPTNGTPLDITGDGGNAAVNWFSVSHGGSVRVAGYLTNTYWGIASDNAVNGPGIIADLTNNTIQLNSGSSGLSALIANADRSVYPVGGLASNSILLDGVTATTQSASDNSTKVATTAYADAAAAAVSTPAAGTNTQVQYNNNGAFGASSNLTFDGTSLTAALSATSTLASGVTATTQAASDNSTKVATTAYADAAAAAVSTPPGGATTQVQYNSGGSFAGSANLTFDGTNLTAALSATSTLANGVTATTQSASDNSTKVATTAYADSAASTAAAGVTTYPSAGSAGYVQVSDGSGGFDDRNTTLTVDGFSTTNSTFNTVYTLTNNNATTGSTVFSKLRLDTFSRGAVELSAVNDATAEHQLFFTVNDFLLVANGQEALRIEQSTQDLSIPNGYLKFSGNPSAGAITASGEGRIGGITNNGLFLYGKGNSYDLALANEGTNIALAIKTGGGTTPDVYIPNALGVGTDNPTNIVTIQKNQAADTALEVYNSDTSSSARASLKVGLDSSTLLHIYRVGNDPSIIYNAREVFSDHTFQVNGTNKTIIDSDGLFAVLKSTCTATTQPLTDNSNKLATTSFVQSFAAQEDSGSFSPAQYTPNATMGFYRTHYVKIGDFCIYNLWAQITSVAGSWTQTEFQLPFTSNSNFYGPAVCLIQHNSTIGSYFGFLGANSDSLQVRNTSDQNVGSSTFGVNDSFYLTVCYKTN